MEVGETLSESILRHNGTCDLGQTLYPLGPPAWYELILLEGLPVACLLLSLFLKEPTHTHTHSLLWHYSLEEQTTLTSYL